MSRATDRAQFADDEFNDWDMPPEPVTLKKESIMGQVLMLFNVRLSYPKLDAPTYFQDKKQRENDKRRWSATFHVGPESTAQLCDAAAKPVGNAGSALKLVNTTIVDVAKAQWLAKAEGVLANVLPDPKACCWIDGARKEVPGVWILSSHRPEDKGRPLVFDADKTPIYKPNNDLYEGKAGRVYAGCYVNAQVEFWAQDNTTGKGLRCTLMGIQRLRDGDAFGGGKAPEPEAFSDVADGADADSLS